jgi:cysteine synthase
MPPSSTTDFAAIGRALRHPVTIFMPDWMSVERIALIRSFGATIRLVSKEEGGFVDAIALAEELAAQRGLRVGINRACDMCFDPVRPSC